MSNLSEKLILDNIYNLILLEHLKDDERNILIKYKNKIENCEYIGKAIEDLKSELSLLAVKKELSEETVKFYTEIARLTPGGRTAQSIFNIFMKKKTNN